MMFFKSYEHRTFIVISFISVLFGFPNLLMASIHLNNSNFFAFGSAMLHFIVTNGIFISPIIFFKIKIRTYLLTTAPLFILTPVIVFTILLYRKFPTRWMFYAILESNRTEITEFLSAPLKASMIVLPLLVVFTAIIFLKNERLHERFRLYFITMFLGLFITAFAIKIYQRKTLDNAFKSTITSFLHNTPLNTSKRVYKALKSFKTINTASYKPTFPVTHRSKTPGLREIFVLVLGESSRYRNWSINGYERNTSPLLNERKDLLSLSDMISPSFNTLKSIPLIVTNANAQNLYNSNSAISIIELFKSAGFGTYWISNQTTKGNIIGNIAGSADKFIQLDCRGMQCYDEGVVKHLQTIVSKNAPKTLIILHLQGNHYPYQNRYPNSFKFFKPDIKKNKHIPFKEKHVGQIINSYDNSILYSDWILNEVINTINIDSASSIMTFISDHGENLFDDDNIGFGRGYGKLSESIFRIPCFIWSSDTYRRDNPIKWKILKSNLYQPATTENLIYAFTDLASISWSDFDSTYSFVSTKFEKKERLFLLRNSVASFDDYFK